MESCTVLTEPFVLFREMLLLSLLNFINGFIFIDITLIAGMHVVTCATVHV